jgi:hypothetical protein
MSRLNAVDARPIFLFKAHEIEWFVPPRIDMRLGKPPLQQWKVGPFKGAERNQVYRPAEYQKSIAGIHRPGTLKVRPPPHARDWYVRNPGMKVELAERQTAALRDDEGFTIFDASAGRSAKHESERAERRDAYKKRYLSKTFAGESLIRERCGGLFAAKQVGSLLQEYS